MSMTGVVTTVVGQSEVWWILHLFQELWCREGYSSPVFHLSDSRWRIGIWRKGEDLEFCVWRKEAGSPPARYTVRLVLESAGGHQHFQCTQTRTFRGWDWIFFISPIKVNKLLANPAMDLSRVTVRCHISPASEEEREFDCCVAQKVVPQKRVSCAAQKEVPQKSVSCATQTEATERRVSSATQTEVLEKNLSCATQTEVEDTLEDKGAHEDGNLSSLDNESIQRLSGDMKELLSGDVEGDLKILVKEKEFRVHSLILCARSPVFRAMLTHDTQERKTGAIEIDDCDPDSFGDFLLHVYSGRVEHVSPGNAPHLLYTADKYEFLELKQRCIAVLQTSLSISSICDVVLLSVKHGERELLDVATAFFVRNAKEIIITPAWFRFMSENMVIANELYIKTLDFQDKKMLKRLVQEKNLE